MKLKAGFVTWGFLGRALFAILFVYVFLGAHVNRVELVYQKEIYNDLISICAGLAKIQIDTAEQLVRMQEEIDRLEKREANIIAEK